MHIKVLLHATDKSTIYTQSMNIPILYYYCIRYALIFVLSMVLTRFPNMAKHKSRLSSRDTRAASSCLLMAMGVVIACISSSSRAPWSTCSLESRWAALSDKKGEEEGMVQESIAEIPGFVAHSYRCTLYPQFLVTCTCHGHCMVLPMLIFKRRHIITCIH